MIMIETVSGAIWCKPEHIHSIFTDKGEFYMILRNNKVSQKWKITRDSYLKIASEVPDVWQENTSNVR